MKKQYILAAAIVSSFILSSGQTIDDIKKLGLTDSQLRTSFEKRIMRLTNHSTGKKKKLKEGAYATVKLKGDTTKLRLILEAFLSDTIIVSSLTPRLTGKEIKLEFTEFKLLLIKDIESIWYSVRHIKGTNEASFLVTLVGIELIVLPVVVPLITGTTEKTYSQPQFPFIIIGGVVLYIWGKKLYKSLIPKEYKIGTDWDYSVVKK